ncbi:hypothetical protein [Nitrobacter sp.]|uniref:hypothetical protein n=1 Tax=Nitrobacter sp. TaxID=29420 RepID=UPI0025DC5909|nr:hypothetical protein [Nitrobacter sp.]
MRDAFTELIDPACVADVFVEGIGEIERIGTNCIRMTMFATRSSQGRRERIVVARLVLQEATLARSLRQCSAFQAGDLIIDENAPLEGARH